MHPTKDTANNMEDKCESRILFFPHIHKKVSEHTRQQVRENKHIYKTIKISIFFHLRDQVITDFR